jgi:ribosome modulation factor
MRLPPSSWAAYEAELNSLPTETERDAFSDGAADASLDYDEGACPFQHGDLAAAWLKGHRFMSGALLRA